MKPKNINERMRLYYYVKFLHKKGLGYKKIKRILKNTHNYDVPLSTIRNWALDINKPLNKYRIPKKSPELAYVIGSWLGDGLLSSYRKNHEYIIRLVVKDFDFAYKWGSSFSKAIQSKYNYKPIWSSKLNRWSVSVSSYYLYNILKVARVTPVSIYEYVKDFPCDFLRGFFDAEGSVNVGYYYITACVNDKQLIDLVSMLLKKIKIDHKIYTFNKKLFMVDPKTNKKYKRKKNFIHCIRISRKKNIFKYAEIVNFSIRRKQDRLNELLSLYKSSI